MSIKDLLKKFIRALPFVDTSHVELELNVKGVWSEEDRMKIEEKLSEFSGITCPAADSPFSKEQIEEAKRSGIPNMYAVMQPTGISRVRIPHIPELISTSKIIKVIQDLGFEVIEIVRDEEAEQKARKQEKDK